MQRNSPHDTIRCVFLSYKQPIEVTKNPEMIIAKRHIVDAMMLMCVSHGHVMSMVICVVFVIAISIIIIARNRERENELDAAYKRAPLCANFNHEKLKCVS